MLYTNTHADDKFVIKTSIHENGNVTQEVIYIAPTNYWAEQFAKHWNQCYSKSVFLLEESARIIAENLHN